MRQILYHRPENEIVLIQGKEMGFATIVVNRQEVATKLYLEE